MIPANWKQLRQYMRGIKLANEMRGPQWKREIESARMLALGGMQS